MKEWRLGSLVGKVLFTTGGAGWVLLGRSPARPVAFLLPVFIAVMGVGALMLSAFTPASEFQGAKRMPQLVPLVRVGGMIVGCGMMIGALLVAAGVAY